MSYSTFHPPENYISKNLAATPAAPQGPPPTFTPIVQPRELPRQRLPESFNLVNPLPTSFSLPSDSAVSLYRASMDNRNVVLRVLNGERRPQTGCCVFFFFNSSVVTAFVFQTRPTPPRGTGS